MGRILGAFVLLTLAGCYSPNLSDPGFFCHVEDNPACPDGQQCVDGRCVTEGVVVNHDSGGGGDDMGGVGGGPTDLSTGGSGDMSKPHDMAKSVDLAQPVDLAQSSCGMSGSTCNTSSDCCSGSICLLNICF
jgi:hypothetical protein